MKSASFYKNLNYNDKKVVVEVVLDTSFSKEIRVLLKEGQIMKEHKAPLPIIVNVLEGEINFGVEGEKHVLKKGAIVTLEGNILHDLTAVEDSVVRLTLSKLDHLERVVDVVEGK